MTKWHSSDIELNHAGEAEPVPIVGDAMVGMARIADGKLLPLLILDTTTRPDIDQVVVAHQHFSAGDVDSDWVRRSRWRKNTLGLALRFNNPVRCVVVIYFDLPSQAILVDQVIRVQGFYLQPGRPGDRMKTTMNAPRILVEVPSERLRDEWETLFHRVTERELRKRGLNKQRAREQAKLAIGSWRSLAAKRVPAAESRNGR